LIIRETDDPYVEEISSKTAFNLLSTKDFNYDDVINNPALNLT